MKQGRGSESVDSRKVEAARVLELCVVRQDALERPASRRRESYQVPYDNASTLADVLRHIQRNPVTTDGTLVAPIAFEYECQEGICGACSVLVDGRVVRACTAKLGELSPRGRPLLVAPLTKFPLVRDLVVDRGRMDADMDSVLTVIDTELIDPSAQLQSPQAQQIVYVASRCTGCAACLEACPEYGLHSDFVGPAVLAEIERCEHQPRAESGRGRRLAVAMDAGGIDYCGKSGNCAVVCPVGIPLTESLGRLSRVATRHWFACWSRD